ncbi:hypothetical protein [Hymenobacter amundsenii]|uniref:hypothetical protein n=1 Tax=Hymenobacter amundsenii TaxID=2006685 RepID=UPI000F824590|nr:hypothetical protein [Hymenobacter amundsenii]
MLTSLLGAVACQQQRSDRQVAAPPVNQTGVMPTQGATYFPATLRAFLARYDVLPLVEKKINGHRVALYGFRNSDRQLMECIILEVKPDENHPDLLHIRGKNRRDGQINAFEGEIRLTQLLKQPQMTAVELQQAIADEREMENDSTAQSLLGTFELRELSTYPKADIIAGRFTADFRVEEQELIGFVQSPDSPSKGGEVLFEGVWTNNSTGKTQPLAWASEHLRYGLEAGKVASTVRKNAKNEPHFNNLNMHRDYSEWWITN